MTGTVHNVARPARAAGCAIATAAVLCAVGPVAATGLAVDIHMTGATIDLVPGAVRGTITLPLHTATIDGTGQVVLFVIMDASDKDFAEMVGAIRADSLEEAPAAAVEAAEFIDGNWTFFNTAGRVTRVDTEDEDGDGDTTEILPPLGNPDYSPLKRFMWDGEEVTINAPFIKWGDGPGEQLLVDEGGCDPLIRRNPPSPFFVGNGPTNGADCTDETADDRYKGGQVVGLDIEAMTVTFKLHKATFDHPDDVPYYIVADASKGPPAGFMGVPVVPKMANLGRFGDNDAVGKIAQFSNGVRIGGGGPNRYQQGLTSYRGGQQGTYSPMWHITWIFFDCDGDGIFFDEAHNIAFGAVPVAGSGEPGFDPADPATFDPFGMDDKGVDCLNFAIAAVGNSDGFIEDLNHLRALVEAGLAVETEGPAGLPLDDPLQANLVVNCSVPLTLRNAADVNSDSNVNVLDLILVLLDFGTATTAPTDVNNDGTVDVLDMIAVLLDFGT